MILTSLVLLEFSETKATFCWLEVEVDAVEPFISHSKTLKLLYKSSKLRVSTPGLFLIIKETCDQAEGRDLMNFFDLHPQWIYLLHEFLTDSGDFGTCHRLYGPKDGNKESNIVCDKTPDASKDNSDDSLVKVQASKDSFVKSSLNNHKETIFLDKKKE
ncbi:hypothetical protein Tco_0715534 [Tanacetum coccineum]